MIYLVLTKTKVYIPVIAKINIARMNSAKINTFKVFSSFSYIIISYYFVDKPLDNTFLALELFSDKSLKLGFYVPYCPLPNCRGGSFSVFSDFLPPIPIYCT